MPFPSDYNPLAGLPELEDDIPPNTQAINIPYQTQSKFSAQMPRTILQADGKSALPSNPIASGPHAFSRECTPYEVTGSLKRAARAHRREGGYLARSKPDVIDYRAGHSPTRFHREARAMQTWDKEMARISSRRASSRMSPSPDQFLISMSALGRDSTAQTHSALDEAPTTRHRSPVSDPFFSHLTTRSKGDTLSSHVMNPINLQETRAPIEQNHKLPTNHSSGSSRSTITKSPVSLCAPEVAISCLPKDPWRQSSIAPLRLHESDLEAAQSDSTSRLSASDIGPEASGPSRRPNARGGHSSDSVRDSFYHYPQATQHSTRGAVRPKDIQKPTLAHRKEPKRASPHCMFESRAGSPRQGFHAAGLFDEPYYSDSSSKETSYSDFA